jgi:uncharacterized NAD(P)/FAD-binding protein YdhS
MIQDSLEADKTSNKTKVTIAIVGAGFSGTMLAVNLLQEKFTQPTKILLFEKAKRFSRGVAYSTQCPLHLLNVPAAAMSAYPDQPQHFLNWAKQRDASVEPLTFVARMEYGNYLQELLDQAAANRVACIEFHKINDDVVDLILNGDQVQMHTQSGSAFTADRLVLALGNFAPANPHVGATTFYQSPRYFQNPWAANQDYAPDAPVLLIGTGLTMVDKALQLDADGHVGVIHALSRHGLLPQVHRTGLPVLKPPYDEATLPATVRQALHDFRQRLETAKTEGTDWRQLIDCLRSVTQKCWQHWPIAEKKRFTRHIRHLWDVHRHRIAPDVSKAIDAMLASGKLQIHAGRILGYKQEKDTVSVTIKQYKTGKQYELAVGAVINCTGPQCNYDKISIPLVESLRKQGLIRADALRLGIDSNADFALLDTRGIPSTVFYTIGPPLKSIYWESVAVPELRVQAKQLAQRLVSSMADSKTAAT